MYKHQLFFLIIFLAFMLSCSSTKYIRKEGLPVYQIERTFEYKYEQVWNAVYNAIAAVADIEIAEESDGIIKTDWSYGESDIDIAEYKIDDQIKYKKLKLRYKYTVLIQKVTGGVKVIVNSDQDYEELGKDFDVPTNSWVSTTSSTVREHNLLENVNTELLKQ